MSPPLEGLASITRAGGAHRASASIGNDPAKPDIVVSANGGNDLIYLPQNNARTLARQVVKALLAQDYTSGVFVRDDLGPVAGTLPLSKVGLRGWSANANAGHRRELPLRNDGLRSAAVLQRDRIRYHPVAGARPSRQL